jgi:Anti-sigma-K factor rskA
VTAHISEDLPLLLTGEASRDTVLDAAAHLRTCPDCQHELVAAVVAHASLTSATRFAPEIAAGLRDAPESAEPPGEPDQRHRTAGAELPDLSPVFAQIRAEAAREQRRPARRRRYLLTAAAAVVVAGAGAGAYVAVSSDNPGAGQTVRLNAFGEGRRGATATIADGNRIRIDAATLPRVSGKQYEVWLTDRARTRMQPIGWLAPDGTAAMTVPGDLLSRYTDIEVSVQDVSASNYTYSGTSVLRGGYS